jgi:site-specific recombinase XerD
MPRRVQQRVEFLTGEEIGRLLRVIPTHTFTGLRLRALIDVLLCTGMRISEALSLDRDSIDYEAGEAEIIGKGGKPRTVFFSPACLRWIGAYLEWRKDSGPPLFVTTGRHPRRLSRNDMSKLFRRLRQRSGINKRLTPHLLRHTFCTTLLHNGADITFIKELAGHHDIETTARYYLGVDKQTLKQILRRYSGYSWTGPETRTAVPEPFENKPIRPALRKVDPMENRSDSAGGPVWPLADRGPDSSGRWSPAARVPGSL